MFTLKNILLSLVDTLVVSLLLLGVMCGINAIMSQIIIQYADLVTLCVFGVLYFIVSLFERVDD